MAKLLVVHDDPTMRSLPQLLQHVVTVPEDGRKELAKFQAGTFDLALPGTVSSRRHC